MLKLSGISALVGLSFAFQSLPVPDGIADFLGSMPFIGILIWIMFYTDKRQKEENQRNREYLERMIEIQDNRHNTTYEAQRDLVNRMIDKIDLLTNQVHINTATVREASGIDEVLKQIIDDRLRDE